jgi:hypothetical protein
VKTFSEAIAINCHDKLNPRLWDGERLKPEVKEALIKFGRAWMNFAKIPEHAVQDIIMVGGNASYCYNESSDIDVHLLVDRSQLGFGPIVDEFLQDRKTLWTLKHAVKVKGYSVEPYAQDVTHGIPKGQGVYSLTLDSWISRPHQSEYDPSQDEHLDKKVSHWKRSIDKAIDEDRGADEINRIKVRISEMRKAGLSRLGELSPENLIFKSLRNDGYLQKMTDYSRDLLVRGLSID